MQVVARRRASPVLRYGARLRAEAAHSFARARGTQERQSAKRVSGASYAQRRAVSGVDCGASCLHLARADVRTLTGCSGSPPSRSRLTYWITSSAVANSVSGMV